MSKNQQFTIRVSPELWEKMEVAMTQEGYHNLNAFVRECIRAYLEPTTDSADQLEQLTALVLWNSLQTQVLLTQGCSDDDAKLASREQLARATQASKQLLEPFLDDQEVLVKKLRQYLRQRHHQKAK